MISNEKNDVRRGEKKSWSCSYVQNNLGQNQDFTYTKEPWGQPAPPQLDMDSNWTVFILNGNPAAHLNSLHRTNQLWSRRCKQVYGVTLCMQKIKVAHFRGIMCSRYTYPPLQTLQLRWRVHKSEARMACTCCFICH